MHNLYILCKRNVIVNVTSYLSEEWSDQFWILTFSECWYAVYILYIIEFK